MTPEGKVKQKVKEVLKDWVPTMSCPSQAGTAIQGHPISLFATKAGLLELNVRQVKVSLRAYRIKNLQSIEQSSGQSLIVNEFNVVNLINLLQEGVSNHEKNIQQVQSLDSPMLRPKNTS
jgi:protein-disulfide isomerase-like protein with CxxC motif